jgi:prepilin-type N-terminal cleavage/methylation domain-containing protein
MRRAFTLIELMVVVAIIGIGGALAAFNMADQVRDARATADTRTVIEDLRMEHRRARELMLGLKVEGALGSGPGGVVHKVRYQWVRDNACSIPVGAPREKTYDLAHLSVLRPTSGVCFDQNGQPVPVSPPPPPAGGGGGGGGNGLPPPPPPAPDDPVLTVKARLSGADRHIVTALRVEPAGITEITTRKGSSDLVGTLEGALITDFKATAAAFSPLKGQIVEHGDTAGEDVAGCIPDEVNGVQCLDVENPLEI